MAARQADGMCPNYSLLASLLHLPQGAGQLALSSRNQTTFHASYLRQSTRERRCFRKEGRTRDHSPKAALIGVDFLSGTHFARIA